ncbi:Ig-like domain-containing protein [uncultured Eudoraea sp.]|uniref:Ig-like domain-containing protein n=1 Tax=uncultured Eudoraea sp. TaxID=1035614 RepID=UPI002629B5B0|nr:Ig-like domain-containing protein [uncultured Eudoraea sp.]
MADYVALDPEVLIGKYVRSDIFQISIINNPEDETFEITVNNGSDGAENSGSGGTSSAVSAGTTVNDTYQTSSSASIVLDVLANDTFNDLENVSISEVTQPDNGEVVINSDNTLTFTPFIVEPTEDTFTYTAEFINEDGTVSKETATVTITINQDPNKTRGELKAFPTAEGFGKYATGGRGKPIYTVTNLNNSGAGSLRQAVEDAEDNDGGTVVFKTGGTINLLSAITVGTDTKGNITIAGETAPGDGITLRMDSSATYGATLEIRGSNVIVRYIRSHIGLTAHSGCDNVRIHTAGSTSEPSLNATLENVIIDHLSLYWNTDESVEIGAYNGGTVRNITVQNCIIAEALESGYGALVYRSSTSPSEPTLVENVSFYANMFNDIKDRYPRITNSGCEHETINNIWYNTQSPFGSAWGTLTDVIGNVKKNNGNVQPSTLYGPAIFKYYQGENGPQIEPWVNSEDGSVYDKDNLIIGDNTGNPLYNSDWMNHKAASRIHSDSPITPMPSSQVSGYVVKNVGHNLARDSHDTRVINNFVNSTGTHVTNETQVGGHLTYATGTPYADADGDNMWDVAEIAIWGNITTTNNPIADENGDGYTNIEETFFYFTGE